MIGKAITTVVALGLLIITLLVMLPQISSIVEAARTDPSTETGLTCNTGAGTSCTITLAAVHQYSDTTSMTVTETAPGATDRTSISTVATDRLDVTISPLTTATAYTFTVLYAIQAANLDDGTADLLRVFIPLVALLLVAAVILGSVTGLFGGFLGSKAR